MSPFPCNAIQRACPDAESTTYTLPITASKADETTKPHKVLEQQTRGNRVSGMEDDHFQGSPFPSFPYLLIPSLYALSHGPQSRSPSQLSWGEGQNQQV